MKRLVLIITIILLIGVLIPPPVVAQTSEGLEWNIEVDDQWHFNIRYWTEGYPEMEDDFYFSPSGVPDAIPDPLTDWWDIPDIPGDLYWWNDTDASGLETFFDFLFKVAVPTGNWSLLADLVENVTMWTPDTPTAVVPTVFLDDWYRWGVSFNFTQSDTDNIYSISYLKSDGSVAKMEMYGYDSGTDNLMGILYMIRDNNVPVVQSPADIIKEVSETGEIVWNATDLSPAAYMIFKDEVEISRGFWNSSSEEFRVNVDGLGIGSYNYTIVLYEASGLSVSDTVMVEVLEDSTLVTTTPPTSTTGTTTTPDGFDPILLIMISAVVGVVIVVVIIVMKMKKS
ncbi:MAG: hypothetical protein RTU92_04465 [Candidatus Thorarchaeota archaeon]